MKNILILIAFFGGVSIGTSVAQPASKVAQEQLKKLSYWVGNWKGEASTRRGPGEPTKINQEENIEFKLDGTLLVVEGIGRSPENDAIVFNAYAIISYNEAKGEYQFKSYLQDGKSTDAWFNVIAENNFEWGFEVPNGKIKYTIILDQTKNSWSETGAYSADGNNWMQFFEMKLLKSN